MKDTKQKLDLDIYNSIVHFIVTDDVLKSRNKLGKKYEYLGTYDEYDGDVLGGLTVYHDDFPGRYWVLISRDVGIKTLMHELFHLTHVIMHHHGAIFEYDNHEPFAYLHEHLVGQFLPTFMKRYDK